jgi:hypothetical protein
VKDSKTTPTPETDAKGTGESAKRRRFGKVVHDDRGCASVEWQDAPEDYVRPVLEIENGGNAQNRVKIARERERPLSIAKQDAFNPYQRSVPDEPTQGSARRDLRKLSKWIKLMRELEEKKALDREEAEKPRED